MKGLYVDVPDASALIKGFDSLLGLESCLAFHRHDLIGDVVVSYHSHDWPHGPIFTDPSRQLFAAASGWFSFKGRFGDLRGLALALSDARTHDQASRVLAGIDGGSFALLLVEPNGYRFISDPFGLHPHYISRTLGRVRLAPSPFFVKGTGVIDPAALRILDRMNHLVGNLTSYVGVERLPPGAIVDQAGAYFYFDYTPTQFDPAEVIKELGAVSDMFADRSKLLPLSGGLDSRLLLATGSFERGFTFGPSDKGDRPIARRFRKRFTKDYDEFSFLDLEYPQQLMTAADMMFDGVCPQPFREILAAFVRLVRRWGSGLAMFDGYLGDVMTRWSWLNVPTLRNQLLRPFPMLRLSGAQDSELLRQRYAPVDPSDYRLVVEAYAAMPVGRSLEPLRRLLLFEILYGRGARYIVNGNCIMAGQFFTCVQPFFFPKIFRCLFAMDLRRGLGLNALHDLWKRLPKDLRQTRTLQGYAPGYPAQLSRLLWFKSGVLKKLQPRLFQDYNDELCHVRWEISGN